MHPCAPRCASCYSVLAAPTRSDNQSTRRVRLVMLLVAVFGKAWLDSPEHVLVFDEAQRAFDAEMVLRSTSCRSRSRNRSTSSSSPSASGLVRRRGTHRNW